MYFPKFWAKASVNGPDRNGDDAKVLAWGWSDISNDDALQRATARATAALPSIPPLDGKRQQYYQDGNRPFREAVLETIGNLVVTRNRLGCDVLNTEHAMFADIDYDPPRVSLFAGLFGGARKKLEAQRASWENDYLEKLRSWQRDNSAWCYRVYRTSGGLRLLATSKALPAGSPEAEMWLKAMGSDPLYIKLCRTHKCYRARLTPKPWRCGYKQPSIYFPYETDKAAQKIAKWLDGYKEKSGGFAVCQFLEAMGFGSPLPELKDVIAFHDDRTRAASNLPLA